MDTCKITSILEGKPFQTQYGIVGYSTVVLLQEEGKNILYDVGPKGCALQLKAALKEQGLEPRDITHVVMSHLHFDHTGNLPLFSEAEILMSQLEWESACKTPDEWQCQMTCAYIKERGNYSFVKEGDQLTSQVSVIELPGHTLGLIGLKCGTDTILCSDALKNRYEMWEDIPLMTMDLAKHKASIERIKREAKYIYPGHDQMLEVDRPIHKEELHFDIRFANGSIKSL